VQGEAPKSPYLDTVSGRERIAHLFQNAPNRQFDVFVRKMALFRGQDFDQLRFSHNPRSAV
jgi:hypothetical protein